MHELLKKLKIVGKQHKAVKVVLELLSFFYSELAIYLLFAGCSATAGAGRPGFAPLGSCVLHCLGQQAGEEGGTDLKQALVSF